MFIDWLIGLFVEVDGDANVSEVVRENLEFTPNQEKVIYNKKLRSSTLHNELTRR